MYCIRAVRVECVGASAKDPVVFAVYLGMPARYAAFAHINKGARHFSQFVTKLPRT
jgi:hypothetical protein